MCIRDRLTGPFLTSVVGLRRIDPTTKTGNFAVSATYDVYSVNGTAATGVVLPSAASSIGRILHFKTYTTSPAASLNLSSVASTDVGAATVSNVIGASGGAAQAIVLAGSAGAYNSTTLVSNGANWYSIRNTSI